MSSPKSDPKRSIETAIQRLRDDRRVRLAIAEIGPPATEQEIVACEALLQRPIPSDLKALYRSFNGAQIAWQPADAPELNWESVVSGLSDDPWTGVFVMPTLDELGCGELEELTEFYEPDDMQDTPYASPHHPLPFDLYSEFTYAAVCRVAKGDEAAVLFGDDHGACWTDYRPVPLDLYVVSIAEASFAVQAREQPGTMVLEDEPTRQPPADLWPGTRPSLDQLLSEEETSQ